MAFAHADRHRALTRRRSLLNKAWKLRLDISTRVYEEGGYWLVEVTTTEKDWNRLCPS